MFKDFRGLLEHLEDKGKLLRVKKPVDTRYEIAAGIRKISDTDGPALLFENVKGFPGWRVAGGVYGTRKLMTLALGTEGDDETIMRRYLEWDQKRIKPRLVPTGPVKETIIKGTDVDLARLPVPVYSDEDSGPYLTAGVEITRHPDTGVQNASIHRRRILDRDRTLVLAVAPQHLGIIIERGEEKGVPVGVATVLGAPPELTIASQIRAPLGVDEAEIAGGIRGEPLEVVRCETIDVAVPANAEVVIEGVTVPGEKGPDGPFAEYPGDYVALGGAAVRDTPVIRVTAITMRKQPIFQACLTGMPMTENHWMKKWAYAAAAYRAIEGIFPYPDDIRGINLTVGGANSNVVIAIHKRSDFQPRDIIYHLLTTNLLLCNVVVVDDDIDPYDARDVEWACATRVWPEEDIIVVPAPPGVRSRRATKWGIDATMPMKDRRWMKKARVPGVENVDYV